MQIGSNGLGHAWGHAHAHVREAMMHRAEASEGQSKGERLVARIDGNEDGKLSIGELRDTKIGRRMSVDQFAKIDSNSDGMLEAGELDAAREARPEATQERRERLYSAAGAESAVRANMAEYLMEKVDDGSADVAARVIKGLDADESGALNSEEIAGTRLAELLGDGFYALDADKNGALGKEELAGFIAEKLMEKTSGEAESDAVSEVEESAETEELIAAEEGLVEPAEEAVSEAVEEPAFGAPSGSSVSEYASRVQAAFENALEMLKGAQSEQSFNAVSALYKDVQSIFETA